MKSVFIWLQNAKEMSFLLALDESQAGHFKMVVTEFKESIVHGNSKKVLLWNWDRKIYPRQDAPEYDDWKKSAGFIDFDNITEFPSVQAASLCVGAKSYAVTQALANAKKSGDIYA